MEEPSFEYFYFGNGGSSWVSVFARLGLVSRDNPWHVDVQCPITYMFSFFFGMVSFHACQHDPKTLLAPHNTNETSVVMCKWRVVWSQQLYNYIGHHLLVICFLFFFNLAVFTLSTFTLLPISNIVTSMHKLGLTHGFLKNRGCSFHLWLLHTLVQISFPLHNLSTFC